MISVFFICVSILSFCLKTHPDMRVPVIRNVTVRSLAHVSAIIDNTKDAQGVERIFSEHFETLRLFENYIDRVLLSKSPPRTKKLH